MVVNIYSVQLYNPFHFCRPELVDLSAVQSRDNVSNLEEAFNLAEKHLKVPRLLEPEGQFTGLLFSLT